MKNVIGLTGQSGAGKSTVCLTFASLGARVVDCDAIAHTALENEAVKANLVEAFGKGILCADGSVDRRALAASAFSSPEKTELLNHITHPYILRETLRQAEEADTPAVIDAPLLFQEGLDAFCDVTVAVVCDHQTRLKRIMARDGITKEQAEARLNAQKDMDALLTKADIVIENGADVAIDDLRAMAEGVYRHILERFGTDQ